MLGCAGITWLAVTALTATLRGNDTEGYILLISVALLVQSALTLTMLSKGSPALKADA